MYDAPDWCPPSGIRFDRTVCPPDDAVTDAQCAVAAAVANARLDCGLDDLGAGARTGYSALGREGSDGPPASAPNLLDAAPVPAPAGSVAGVAASSAGAPGLGTARRAGLLFDDAPHGLAVSSIPAPSPTPILTATGRVDFHVGGRGVTAAAEPVVTVGGSSVTAAAVPGPAPHSNGRDADAPVVWSMWSGALL